MVENFPGRLVLFLPKVYNTYTRTEISQKRAMDMKQRSKRKKQGSLWPLILILLLALAVLAVLFLLPGGQQDAPESSSAPVTTTTTAPTTTTTTTKVTTTTRPATSTQAVDSSGNYLDANGMLQLPTEGRYVQAGSYAAGEEIPWNLRLVNDWNPLPEGYEDKVTYKQLNVLYRRLDSHKGDSRVLEHLDAMMAAGRAAGIKDLAVQSAYRTVATQKRLYWNEVDEHRTGVYSELKAQYAANTVVKRPGYSEHHLGLAFDLGGNGNFNLNQNFEKTEAFKWLIAHCHEYGFILRFPKGKEAVTGVIYEPWHYRYVGVEAATYIMENGLCLEEYLAQIGK